MTGGRGPDACIDAVGMEAHGTGPSTPTTASSRRCTCTRTAARPCARRSSRAARAGRSR
jgi:hypothetical protein